jgi:hypothetical protein
LSLKLDTIDFKNAAMITFSCAVATISSRWFTLPELIWVIIITALLPFSKIGVIPKKRHISLILTGIAGALFVAVTILLNSLDWLVLPWLFISAFVLYCLPRYIPGSYAPGLFILIFMVIAHSMPGSTFVAVRQAIEGILLGTLIVTLLNVLFDRDKTPLPAPPLDKSLYLIQRALRVAVMITLIFFISHFVKIQNPSWVALTVIIIDQNSLGASVKKAWYRLLGTLLGVIAGILLAHYIFAPYPLSRWSALLMVFLTFLFVRVNYAMTIFFSTILLAVIFYLFAGAQITLVEYMISRLVDILVGVIIGVVGQLLIFPKTLFQTLRQGFCRFWRDAGAWIVSDSASIHRSQALAQLNNDFKVIEQDVKDFRYEPISFLFQRYHLTVSLLPLIKDFLRSLDKVSALPAPVSGEANQALQTLLMYYKNPDLNSIEPLEKSLQELMHCSAQFSYDVPIKSLLENLQKILYHFQIINQTPRWRLELK